MADRPDRTLSLLEIHVSISEMRADMQENVTALRDELRSGFAQLREEWAGTKTIIRRTEHLLDGNGERPIGERMSTITAEVHRLDSDIRMMNAHRRKMQNLMFAAVLSTIANVLWGIFNNLVLKG